MHWTIPFVVGAMIGVPIGLLYGRFRARPLPVRIGLGLLVGLGIAFVINAGLEILDLASEQESNQATAAAAAAKTELPAAKSEPAAAPSSGEPAARQQEQRYEDGTLKATRTVIQDELGNLVPHGPAATYFSNGQLKWTGTYDMGQQSGSWTEYYMDGSKEGEGLIKDDGSAVETHWHSNGKQKSKGSWANGVKHGEWTTWYASGQQAGVYRYDRGQLHGTVREWHENGRPKLEVSYEHGLAVEAPSRWDEQGQAIDTALFP